MTTGGTSAHTDRNTCSTKAGIRPKHGRSPAWRAPGLPLRPGPILEGPVLDPPLGPVLGPGLGILLCAFLCALLALPALPARATEGDVSDSPADSAGAEIPDAPAPHPRAPVVIDGETLFSLTGISSFPADRRSARAAEGIVRAARDADLDPASLTVLETDLTSRLMAGDQALLDVYDADADATGVHRQVLAQLYLGKVQGAIRGYRAARTPRALLTAAGHAALATLAFLLAVWLIRRAHRRLDRFLEERVHHKVSAVSIQSLELVRAERVRRAVSAGVRFLSHLALLALTFAYLSYLLYLFPWTRGAGHRLDDWVLAPLALIGGGILARLPDLVFLAVLAVATHYLLRLVHVFFKAVGRGQVELDGFEPSWAEPTYRLVKIALIAFALVVAYPYIPGSSTDAFKALSVFFGFLISLASSSSVANSLAGYSLIFRSPYREGDVVKIGDVFGVVDEIRVPVTRLRTPKEEVVVIPNLKILSSEVVNYSTRARDRELIVSASVGIGYDTPWRQVEAMLLEAARRTQGLSSDPPPFVLTSGLGDFAVDYQVNAHCPDPAAMPAIHSRLHRHILDVFNEHAVQIMSPHYRDDTPQPKVVPKEKWHLAPAEAPGVEGGGRGG